MDSVNKDKIKIVINDILECGYYMRGWKVGSQNIPVTSSQCEFSYDKEGLVYLNVTQSILKLEKDVAESGYENFLWNLPLMNIKRSGSEIKYQASTNVDSGLTVRDRINIVKDNHKDNPNACIRMSSNWFMVTGYYYSIALSIPTTFDINLLSDIS